MGRLDAIYADGRDYRFIGFWAKNPVNPVNYVYSLCSFTMFFHIVYFTGFVIPLGFASLVCCSGIVSFAESLLRGGSSSNPVK